MIFEPVEHAANPCLTDMSINFLCFSDTLWQVIIVYGVPSDKSVTTPLFATCGHRSPKY